MAASRVLCADPVLRNVDRPTDEPDESAERGATDTTDVTDVTDDRREEFDRVRERAAEAIDDGDDLDSVYVGLVGDDEAMEYYFGNTVDEEQLREVAAAQLGMLTRVLADQSAATVEEVADLAAERAKSMNLRT